MRKKGFIVEQMIRVLKQAEVGVPVPKALFCDSGGEFTSQAVDL